MDILTAIYGRRSIRDFQDKPVAREILEKLIDAATQAPSAENEQPWHFAVVEDLAIKKQIGEISVSAGQKYFGPKKGDLLKKFAGMGQERCAQMVERFTSGSLFAYLCTAPALIVVSCEDDFFNYASTGAAIQNLMLAALEFKLSTCWAVIGLTNEKHKNQIARLARVPKGQVMIGVIAVGYAAQEPKPRGRKDVSEITTWI